MKSSLLRNLASLKITYILLTVLIVELILFTAFMPTARWNRSVIFLFPLLLFFINLLSCTLWRIKKQNSLKYLSRIGPDLIHIGILILILCGLFSPFLKEEREIMVEEGDRVSLPDNIQLEIESVNFHTYNDGRPKEWLVNINRNGMSEALKINHPYQVGKVRIFLQSFQSIPYIQASREDSDSLYFSLLEGLNINGQNWELVSMEQKGKSWKITLTNALNEVSFSEGELFENLRIERITLLDKAMLLLVIDPFRYIYPPAFIIIIAGIIISLLKRWFNNPRKES